MTCRSALNLSTDQFIHELKFDGFHAHLESGHARAVGWNLLVANSRIMRLWASDEVRDNAAAAGMKQILMSLCSHPALAAVLPNPFDPNRRF